MSLPALFGKSLLVGLLVALVMTALTMSSHPAAMFGPLSVHHDVTTTSPDIVPLAFLGTLISGAFLFVYRITF